jgi:hypothetical protein
MVWCCDCASFLRPVCCCCRYACRDARGQYYREAYESDPPHAGWWFYVMDPASSYWQQKIAGVASYLASFGVDGLYVDQIGCAYPEPCFTTATTATATAAAPPPLPQDGWGAWAAGGRATLLAAAAALGPQKFLMSEGQAEFTLGAVTAGLAIYGFNYCNSVPAYQAVWGGYAALVGTEQWGDLDASNTSSRALFAIRTAQLFVNGQLLGWFSAGAAAQFLAAPEVAAAEASLLRAAAAARLANPDLLLFGTLARPPAVTTPLPPLPVPGTVCYVPSVLAAVWRAGSGRRAVVLANPTATAQAVVVVAVKEDGDGDDAAGVAAACSAQLYLGAAGASSHVFHHAASLAVIEGSFNLTLAAFSTAVVDCQAAFA